MSTAVSSARYEFGCQEVTGEKISRVTQKNAWQSSKSIDSFKIGVAGCGKSDVIAVECGVREDSGCEFQDAQRIKQRDLK